MPQIRRLRELRHWDYTTDGPVPDWYWQQRAEHIRVVENEKKRTGTFVALLALGWVVLMAAVTIVMTVTGQR